MNLKYWNSNHQSLHQSERIERNIINKQKMTLRETLVFVAHSRLGFTLLPSLNNNNNSDDGDDDDNDNNNNNNSNQEPKQTHQ